MSEVPGQRPEFGAELPRFQAAVWNIFNPYELAGYLRSLKPSKRKKLRELLYVNGSLRSRRARALQAEMTDRLKKQIGYYCTRTRDKSSEQGVKLLNQGQVDFAGTDWPLPVEATCSKPSEVTRNLQFATPRVTLEVH